MRRFRKQIHPSLVGLFDDETARVLTGVGTVLAVEPGTMLTRQGSTRYQLTWLLSGHADVIRNGEVIAELSAGSVCGEITTCTDELFHTADVRITEPAEVLVLATGEWRMIAEQMPELAAELAEVADRRLAVLSA